MNHTFDDILRLENEQLEFFVNAAINLWRKVNERMIFDVKDIYCTWVEIFEMLPFAGDNFSSRKIVYTDLEDTILYEWNGKSLIAAAFSQQLYRLRYQYFFSKREALIDFVGDDAFAAFADDDMDFHIQPHIAKQYGIRNIKLEQQQQ